MSTPATSSALAGSAILSLQTKRTERYDDYRRIVVESKSAEALHAALDELLAQATAQAPEQSRAFRPWLWVSVSAAAGLGALQLCEFVFVAFVAASAH